MMNDRHSAHEGFGRSAPTNFVGTAWAAWTAAAVVVAIAVLSTFALSRPDANGVSGPVAGGYGNQGNGASAAGPEQGGDQGQAGGGSAGQLVGGRAGSPGTKGGPAIGPAKSGGSGAGAGASSARCGAGQNGGNTDTGVSSNQIKLASTVVKSGIGTAFLGDVEFGMLAKMNKTNRAGGICGRQMSLKLVDDGWNASSGESDIRNFINEGYFALAVEPSSEGLRGAIDAGDIDNAGIPVVGTDGMLQDQYTDKFVWPVSTSTSSLMHIMAKYAYGQGARDFGLVYDGNYRFGVEGEAAFRGALSRLGSANLVAEQKLQAGQPSYDPTSFNVSCASCDFVGLLLEPDTANAWIQSGAYLGTSGKHVSLGAAGPQTLFTYHFGQDFAQHCNPSSSCHAHFLVWTGFKPPVSPDDTDPAVQTYVGDLAATNSSADKYNQFVEGGYAGMALLVQSLQQVGPNLTRAALRQVLDQTNFSSGLTGGAESWRPGRHFANITAQAFSLVINNGAFVNFRYENTSWVSDPWVGQDLLSG